MANIKVSEMTEANSFDDGDYTMIVQANQNKKISKENMLSDIPTIQSNITTINTNIGNLTNLQTPTTDDLVSAINSLHDEMFYKDGDTYEIQSDYTGFAGLITGGTTSMRFTIPLPKKLTNISSITVNTLTLNVRLSSGGYLVASNTNFLASAYTVTTTVPADNLLVIIVQKSSAFTGATNNSPIVVTGIAGSGIKVTFNE